MVVILKENVDNLGLVGDVVKVSDGYARNFLIPRQLVIEAVEGNLKQIEHHKRSLEAKRRAMIKDSEALAAQISQLSLTFTRKVGRKDKLFGSVTAGDIHAEIEKAGFRVGKNTVQLVESIKSLGEFSVQVKLQPNVSASIKLTVEAEK